MGTLQTEAGWLHRLLATVRSRSIDDRLLAGEPANGDRVTLARRARLLDRRYRSAIAAALRRLLDAARRNQRNLFAANLPLQEEAVLESAPLILSLAAELEEEETVNPRGVILADRLIRDGSSPVYWPPPCTSAGRQQSNWRSGTPAPPYIWRELPVGRIGDDE